MNSNQNYQNGNMCEDFKNFVTGIINNMPLFIKIVVFSTIILYILNLFIPYVAFYLADIPYYTIYYFQIWRLITTSFMTTGILSIIFSLLFWYKEAVKVEKATGTIKYMLIFSMNTFFIQILYCLLMLLISLVIRNKVVLLMKISMVGVRNAGLWPIILCDLTLLCLSNPEAPMKIFIFPCVIKAKYYPFVLFLFFTIISRFNIDFESLCAIGYGLLYHYYLKSRLTITNTFALKVENSWAFKWMKQQKGFVFLGGVSLPELQNNIENVASERNVNISGNRGSQHKTFTPFKGKGMAVGASTDVNFNKNIINIENKNKNNNENKTNTESTEKTENNETHTNTDYNNISIGSSVDMNSTDSRLDLNSSNSKN